MKRQMLAVAAVVLGLAMISPEVARAETGAGQEYGDGEGISGEFQLAKAAKPKKKKRA